ncbi:hypothetical protein FGL68_06725 [Acinetobacter baumannii]|nr:hypothetical protein [Acinetobacter baumannii]
MISNRAYTSYYKEEIKKYKKMLYSNKELPKENDVISIIKKIIFMKILNYDKKPEHYRKCIIYDMLMLMHSLTQNSIINFYFLYRAYIENFLRVSLNLGDNDETGVRNLFVEFENKYNSKELEAFINYIKGEYGKGCNYVHSNIKSMKTVHLYYKEIIETDEMDDKNLIHLIQKLNTLLDKCVEFMILTQVEEIENVFYRKSEQLKFLIGNKNYKIYKDNLI